MSKRSFITLATESGRRVRLGPRLKRLAKSLWIIPAVTVVLSTALMLLAAALFYTRSTVRIPWLVESVMLAPFFAIAVSVLVSLTAFLFWIAGVLEFREIRFALTLSLLNAAAVWLTYVEILPNMFRF